MAARPEKPTTKPQDLFKKPQEAELLDFHSGYDVGTPKGLLDFQHWALNQVCGKMPRIKREPHTLKLSKTTRNELIDLQENTTFASMGAEFEVSRLRTLCQPSFSP